MSNENKEIKVETKVWWAIPETGFNSGWIVPAFALGELVWLRSDPREGLHVTGIAWQEGWQDEEEDEWHDGWWQYQVMPHAEKYNWLTDAELVGLAEHGAYLKGWLEWQQRSNDFDPFLDVGDLP